MHMPKLQMSATPELIELSLKRRREAEKLAFIVIRIRTVLTDRTSADADQV
jgi:hypothetical protein